MIGVFYYLLWLQTRQPYTPFGFLDDATGDQLFNAARTSATLLGVSGLGGAALIAYRKQRSTEETLDNERVSALHERYSTAAEQLGHDNPAIRLAGVYGLASLADDWKSAGRHGETQVCIDLLCAYLRAENVHMDRRELDVRTAIVAAIHSRLRSGDSGRPSWRRYRFDLSGTDMEEADLSRAELVHMDLMGVSLVRANLARSVLGVDVRLRDSFTDQLEDSMRSKNAPPRPPRGDTVYLGPMLEGVHLTEANMRGAQLPGCNLAHARLWEADLTDADMTQTNLITAELSNAILVRAKLVGAVMCDRSADGDLSYAKLDGANLTKAHLKYAVIGPVNLAGANLSDADLRYAYIGAADLSRADLSGADLRHTDLGAAQLTGIKHDNATQWPTGFDVNSVASADTP
ncbi:pentapeptide repeat-containing protein [Rhodococcus sp. ACS1]|uniref:pentapeptide repeat-containing protein n=1 Tax=Rhodococcus sp. ACS1 TaxID=2028570 RepID=UPI00211BE12F|nr:pentapeptide repeat-containing protein [Rhodococcus sp. ACS1]